MIILQPCRRIIILMQNDHDYLTSGAEKRTHRIERRSIGGRKNKIKGSRKSEVILAVLRNK